jgi:hypothetical protein
MSTTRASAASTGNDERSGDEENAAMSVLSGADVLFEMEREL